MNASILSLLETIKIDKLTVLNIFEGKSRIFQSKQHNYTEQRTFLYFILLANIVRKKNNFAFFSAPEERKFQWRICKYHFIFIIYT